MHQVKGEYPDYTAYSSINSFHLNADKDFNPYEWSAPIQWEGHVGNEKVKFIQISSEAFSLESFDWTGFPEKLKAARPYIVTAIDEAMRTMD